MHLLKQIKRKNIASISTSNNVASISKASNNSEKVNTSNRVVCVMEDILNILRNKPSVELNEDIEYSLDRFDHKTN